MSDKNIEFKPNNIVKSCKYLEKGLCFQLDGLHCCVHGSISSPVIVSTEEIQNGSCSYNLIVQRKKELFLAINGKNNINSGDCKNCCHIKEKKFKDVSFEYIGGEPLSAGFNIQHYTECNERCSYCIYAQENNFQKPQYDILKIWEIFREKGKLRRNNWIDFSGGEPAMLKNLDEILSYILKNKIGRVVIYSNAAIYSPLIYKGLKENKFILTTSLDTGLKSTYAKLRGADVFEKVVDNLTKYRNSGTTGLWLKYVITDDNGTDDDMWSFISLMLALRPDRIYIAPDFPYGEKEIPYETVKFAAKMWYLLEKYLGEIVFDYTMDMGDSKFKKYNLEREKEIKRLKENMPISKEMNLKQFKRKNYNLTNCLRKINEKIPNNSIFNKIREFARTLLISWGIY